VGSTDSSARGMGSAGTAAAAAAAAADTHTLPVVDVAGEEWRPEAARAVRAAHQHPQ
jgi:homoserine kinase